MTDHSAAPTPPPRRSRKGLYIPLVLFALVCAGWAGAWMFARSKAIDVMDAWIAREERLGRTWTCPERVVDGFPFRIQVSCTAPTFVSREPGRAGRGALSSFSATARVVDPRNLIAAFGSPLTWTAAAGDTVELTFATARASYRGTPSAVDEGALELADAVLNWRAPTLEPQRVTAKRAELHVRRTPGAEPGTDLAATLTELDAPVLSALLGEPAPAALEFRATVTGLLPAPPRDWRATLEDWRRGDGAAKIERLNISKGALSLNAKGTLQLDEFRRPVGTIEGQATGLALLLARFGAAAGGGGGLLGSLLAGAQRPDARPRPLPVSIRFDNGRVFFGPVPGPRLPPLY